MQKFELMKFISIQVFIILIFILYACNTSEIKTIETNNDYQLVWEDDFKDGLLDTSKWKYEIGYVRNNEEQYYTKNLKNVRVENDHLILAAAKEEIQGYKYSSGSITTSTLVAWQYGKIEVKAKLPQGIGIWPAIWMLGENWQQVSWPKCGEIDIMEHVGFVRDSIYGTVHTEAYNHEIGTAVGKGVYVNQPYDEFHIYSVKWTPQKIDFLLDNVVYHSFKNENKTAAEWPFDQKFHLKLNVAVGGSWGGAQGIDDNIFSQQMVVDYVKVFQKNKI